MNRVSRVAALAGLISLAGAGHAGNSGRGFVLGEGNWAQQLGADRAAISADTAVTAVTAVHGRFFAGTSNRGVFESADDGKTWQRFDVQKIPMLADAGNQRQVYAFDFAAAFITHKHDILVRLEQGGWLPVKTDMGRSVIFTAIHRGQNTLYLGTSVNGLKTAALSTDNFRALAAGRAVKLKFAAANAGLPGKPHDKSHFIYEEVQAVHELAGGDLLVATGPRTELYLRKKGAARFQNVPVTGLGENFDECKGLSSTDQKIVLSCGRGIWTGRLGDAAWSFTGHDKIAGGAAAYALADSDGALRTFVAFKSRLTDEKRKRMQSAAGQRIMYASAFTWHKKQARVLEELRQGFWTGLVIDGKDDNGIIRYDSEVPLAKSIGAVRPLYKMADVAAQVHALGKRLIVRLVIFKDPKLFEREGYAILDAGGGKWVGTPKERWIDPYNPQLLSEYYAPMMQELGSKGVDEIQLDYIRFPSDGPVGRCRFAHKGSLMPNGAAAPDYYFSEALENFLTGVRRATHLPIGADIYGYNGMYRVPGAIGQDLEVYGRVLDVISPMHYSSHFGDDYMRHLPRDERTYNLLLLALKRGAFFARGEFVMRPYIQAFSMKDGLWGYGKKYFADQIKGVADGGGDGFLFWGKLDDMTLVRKTQTNP